MRLASSDFDDEEQSQTEQGIRFKRLIMDKTATSRAKDHTLPIEPDAKRVVFCTGKVYYELDTEREAMGRESDVKIVRVEQLSPFPWDLVDRELRRYPNAEVVWCQEEPMNMGAWAHVACQVPDPLQAAAGTNRPLDALRRRRQGALCVHRHGVRIRARRGTGGVGQGGAQRPRRERAGEETARG